MYRYVYLSFYALNVVIVIAGIAPAGGPGGGGMGGMGGGNSGMMGGHMMSNPWQGQPGNQSKT